MVAYIKESGGIEYTEHLMYEHANRAKLILQHYADSETKDALMQYVDNVTQRKF
jgi:octaprenyl-diphosphate synthase